MGLEGSLVVVARVFVDELEENYQKLKYIHTSNSCTQVNPPYPHTNDYHSLIATEHIVFVLFFLVTDGEFFFGHFY